MASKEEKMQKKLAEAFGLFIVIVVGSIVLKIAAAFIEWIPFRSILEIGGLAALMWLMPLGLVPVKSIAVKMSEKWKRIDV